MTRSFSTACTVSPVQDCQAADGFPERDVRANDIFRNLVRDLSRAFPRLGELLPGLLFLGQVLREAPKVDGGDYPD